MDWSTRRQLTYIAGILAFIIIVIGVIVLRIISNIEPTCFDGKQNQDEQGVDCGGVCSLVCVDQTKNLVVLWAQPVQVRPDVYNVLAEVENLNPSAGIQSIDYRFRLYDAENILVAEKTNATFIGPNDRTLIFDAAIETGNRVPVTAFFDVLSPQIWVDTDPKFGVRQVMVSNAELMNEDTLPRLSARVRNTTEEAIHDIYLVALIKSVATGNAVGASQTYVKELSQGSSQDVVFTWPEPFTETVVFEITPRINPFHRKNR